jgi:hypothetical protein
MWNTPYVKKIVMIFLTIEVIDYPPFVNVTINLFL